MATRRTDETVRVGSDTKGAEKGFKKFSSLGKAVLLAMVAVVTAGLVKMGGELIAMFRTQEQAELRLRRALVASGQYTADYEAELHEIAGRIQLLTKVGDEATLAILQQLVTVGRVSRDQIEDATLAIIGFAEQSEKAPDRIAKTWSKLLAQLADESKSSLGGLEVYFSNAQIAMLKALKTSEGGMAAQAKAIGILRRKFGEFAFAVEGSTDVYTQLSNSWGDLKEEVGRVIHLLVGPLAEWIQGWLPLWVDGLKRVYVEMATLGVGWDVLIARAKSFFSGDDSGIDAAVSRLRAAREKVMAEMVAGGASTASGAIDTSGTSDGPGRDTSADEARAAEQTRLAKQRLALARATLNGMSDAELKFQKTQSRIANERAKALALTDKKITKAHGEALLEALALEERIASDKLLAANRAAFQAMQAEFSPELLERRREAAILFHEAERELGLELDELDREYLILKLETEAELRRQYRQQELDELIAARTERIHYEHSSDEDELEDEKTTKEKKIQQIKEYLDTAAQLQQSGNTKLAKIGRAAARARLLVDLATKPYEAYAKTSALYGFPHGHLMGQIHAALVVAQLGLGLAAVGGGGGGGGGGRGGGGAPSSGVPPPSQMDEDGDDPASTPQVIMLQVDLDGQTLAEVITPYVQSGVAHYTEIE